MATDTPKRTRSAFTTNPGSGKWEPSINPGSGHSHRVDFSQSPSIAPCSGSPALVIARGGTGNKSRDSDSHRVDSHRVSLASRQAYLYSRPRQTFLVLCPRRVRKQIKTNMFLQHPTLTGQPDLPGFCLTTQNTYLNE